MTYLSMCDASRIFRAMQGDKEAQARTSIDEVVSLHNAETFTDFLAVNQIVDPTEIRRKAK